MSDEAEEIDSLELLRTRAIAGVGALAVYTLCAAVAFSSIAAIVALLVYSTRFFYWLARTAGAPDEGSGIIAGVSLLAFVGLLVVSAAFGALDAYVAIKNMLFGEEFMKRDHACCPTCGVYFATARTRHKHAAKFGGLRCPACSGIV